MPSPVNSVATTKPIRTSVGSTPERAAMPPATPPILRSVLERVRRGAGVGVVVVFMGDTIPDDAVSHHWECPRPGPTGGRGCGFPLPAPEPAPGGLCGAIVSLA